MIYNKDLFDFLKKNKFIPSKKMGQNFLIDKKIINKILETIKNYFIGNFNLLEIGPGLGSLSFGLQEITNSYKAIEIDKRLYSHLLDNKIIPKDKLICDDALKLDWNKLFESNSDLFVVGNLPYSISTRLIDKFINSKNSKIAIIMVQKEMAERIAAKVNSKDYNYFSAYLQSKLNVKKLFLVNRLVFYPKPAVESCIVMLTKKEENFKLDKKFEDFLKLCFAQRRKTLFNNLKNNYDLNKLISALYKISKNEKTRAQELSWKELLKIKEDLDG